MSYAVYILRGCFLLHIVFLYAEKKVYGEFHRRKKQKGQVMKQNRKTKYMQSALYMAISLMMAVFVLATIPEQVMASKKAVLSSKSMVIGVGTYKMQGNTWKEKDDFYRNVLIVENAKKNASYSFTSKNKKVATVKNNGTKCYITGVKAGKTTITCYQTLNGKKTAAGSCKVEVKNSSISDYGNGNYEREGDPDAVHVAIAENMYMDWNGGSTFNFAYMNAQATYQCVVDKPGLSFAVRKENVPYKDDMKWIQPYYTATKAGTYTVTVKETYKKKTRTAGKVKFVVHAPEAEKNRDMAVGDTLNPFILVFYPPKGLSIDGDGFDIADANNGQAVYVDDDFVLHAVKEGTAVVKLYVWDSEKEELGEYIGSCTVTVKGAKVKEVYEKELRSYDGEYDKESINIAYELMENASHNAKYETVGKGFDIKDADSGEAVYIDENGELQAIRPGTATVEIYYWDTANDTIGEYIGSCVITVTESE